MLLIVVLKGETIQVEACSWGQWHMYLVAKKSIRDISGRVVIDKSHYYASDHLPDLMIDKALADYIEDKVIFIKFFNLESNYIPLSLWIFRPEIFGVIMEVMTTNELPTTSSDSFK